MVPLKLKPHPMMDYWPITTVGEIIDAEERNGFVWL